MRLCWIIPEFFVQRSSIELTAAIADHDRGDDVSLAFSVLDSFALFRKRAVFLYPN